GIVDSNHPGRVTAIRVKVYPAIGGRIQGEGKIITARSKLETGRRSGIKRNPGKIYLRLLMYMAAETRLHIAMAAHDSRQLCAIAHLLAVEPLTADIRRRVMHKESDRV